MVPWKTLNQGLTVVRFLKFCHILMIISVFDIKSNQCFMFIHILDQSLFDCGVKSFWNQIWSFFFKKKLQNWQKNAIFSGTIDDHIFASRTQCKKPHFFRSPSFRNTFFNDPLSSGKANVANQIQQWKGFYSLPLLREWRFSFSCHFWTSTLWKLDRIIQLSHELGSELMSEHSGARERSKQVGERC